ncbi:MAG: 6-phosphofructokinase, partial [Candidatus Omnitrophota bacterium]
AGRKKGKVSWIIVVSEGVAKATDVVRMIKRRTGFDVRPVVLGHIQRGGSPTAFDRILASHLGYAAVEALVKGRKNAMVGTIANEPKITPYKKAIKTEKKKITLDNSLYKLTKILAT